MLKISPTDYRLMPVAYVEHFMKSIDQDLERKDPWLLPPPQIKL